MRKQDLSPLASSPATPLAPSSRRPALLPAFALVLGCLSGGVALAGDDEKPALPKPEPYILLQVWGTAYDQDQDPIADPASYGDPEDDMGFKVRRARFGFRGDADGIRYAVVAGVSAPYDQMLDTPDDDIGLVDAYAGFKVVKGLWLSGGLQEVPLSREHLMSSGDLVLAERTAGTQWMIPDREVGLVFDGRFGPDDKTRARVRLGAFNGNGDLFTDDNAGKLVTARAEFATGGNAYETWGKVNKVTVGFAGDFFMNPSISTDTLGYGADLIFRVQGLAVLVEGHMATISPANSDLDQPGVLEDTTRTSVVAQAGYSVQHFEPAVRFGMFDDNGSNDDNGDVGEVSGGLTYHMRKDALRFGGAYVARLELQGTEIPNDTVRLWAQLRY